MVIVMGAGKCRLATLAAACRRLRWRRDFVLRRLADAVLAALDATLEVMYMYLFVVFYLLY